VKPVGGFFPQLFSMRLRESGTFKLIPSTFALMAVHKQTAASRSVSPWIKLQHGIVGGDPTTTFTKWSILAHTPSFKVSIEHVCCPPQFPVSLVPLTIANKTRFSDRKRETEGWLVLEAMFKCREYILIN